MRARLAIFGVFVLMLCGSFVLAQTASSVTPIPPRMAGPAPMMGMVGFSALEKIPNAPFCGTVISGRAQNLADGNRIQQTSSERICRDSQGRTRREMDRSLNTGALGGPLLLTTIFDPVANVIFTLNERQHTALKREMLTRVNTSTPFSHFVFTPRPNDTVIVNGKKRKPPELTVEDLGEGSVSGFTAKGTRITRIIPAGDMGNEQPIRVVSETWYSEALKMNLRTRHSDPRMGDTLSEITNILTGEPDPVLFQVPADYTIQEPPSPRIGPAVPSSKP